MYAVVAVEIADLLYVIVCVGLCFGAAAVAAAFFVKIIIIRCCVNVFFFSLSPMSLSFSLVGAFFLH